MSLPISGHPLTELKGQKEQPPNHKPTIRSILSHLKPLHVAFLAVVILSQLAILLLLSQSSSSESPPAPQPSLQLQPKPFADDCDSRRIYVYDLPPVFNHELKNKACNISNHCNTILNDNFGPAATELAGIVPESVLPAWHWTDVFWGDVLYHRRMLNYACRAMEPESATAFYMPFYAGLATGPENHWRLELFIEYIQEQKPWKRSNGSDHFIMLGKPSHDFRRPREDNKSWGSSFLRFPEILHNVVHFTLDGDLWEEHEIAVPYPTMFHPRSEPDIVEWQSFVRTRQRNHLFAFLGGAPESVEDSFRGILQKQCLREATACRRVDCYGHHCGHDGMAEMMAAFLDSDFCLQEGDVFAKYPVLECMLAGSIPVFFSTANYLQYNNYLQYELFMPVNSESYSVIILRDNVRSGTEVESVLEGYGEEEVARMREKIVEYMPRFLYAKPSHGLEETRDAFDIAIEGVLSKYRAHMDRGRKGNYTL